MKQVYAVFETDRWHSHQSQTLLGVFTSKKMAINAVVRNNDIDDDEFFDCVHDMIALNKKERMREIKRILRKELEDNNQTQGYYPNYIIEEYDVNSWFR